MHYTFVVRTTSAPGAVRRLREEGYEVDLHPRPPRARDTHFSVYRVREHQRSALVRLLTRHAPEWRTPQQGFLPLG